MPVGASIGAVGSLGAAGLGFLGSSAASKAQTSLGQQSLAQQQQMFNTAQGALKPYIDSGSSALPTLQKLLTPGASMTDTLSQLPGFKFQSEWGNMSASNALAARGLGGSTGPLAKAISDYNSGLASTSYSNLVGQEQNFVNMGSGAAGALAGQATQTGANMGNTLTGIGQAQAQGALGQANAIGGGIAGAAGAAGNAYLLNNVLGGQGGFYGGTNYNKFASADPNGTSGSDLAQAAQAGVNQGLDQNWWTGAVG